MASPIPPLAYIGTYKHYIIQKRGRNVNTETQ